MLGILAFLAIAGPRFLDPTNVAWLVGGDPLQHYLGWAFYRNGPWTWPVGLNPLYGMEFSNSIVFTDSIPLLAIPFKAISSILPNPFQYLGLWVLLCFVLQAYFAFRLIGLISSGIAIQILGSIFFVFSPPLIFRMSLHESLMGHFIILAALYLNLDQADSATKVNANYKRLIAWIVLLSIAVLTHFYLAVMVLVLWIADLCNRAFVLKRAAIKNSLLEVVLVGASIGLVAWQAGYFAIQGASGATRGFGDFRTNLLALFNSRGWSYFLKPIPLRDSVEAATGEGFQYLGAGSLLLMMAALYAVIKRKVKVCHPIKWLDKRYSFLILALALMAVISFSNRIGFGPWNFTIPLPDFIIGLLSLVRSSSRLFWPIYYMIVLALIWLVVKAYSHRAAMVIFLCAAMIQIVDTSAGWLLIRAKVDLPTSSVFKTKLQNPFWQDAGSHYKNVVTNGGQENWESFGMLATENGMSTNIAYLARTDKQKESDSFAAVNQQLHAGPLREQSLYVLQDWKSSPDRIQFDPEKDLLARIDGINVLAPGWKVCSGCSQVSKEYELKQLAPPINIGQVIDFTKNGNGRENFMLGGWGFTEDWGTWATDSVSKVILPMPEGNPSKLIIKANAFLSPSHASQLVDIAVNGARVGDHQLLSNAKDNFLEIKLPKGAKTPGDPVLVEFHSLDAISPMNAGLGLDERKLGIGLVSIQFVR